MNYVGTDTPNCFPAAKTEPEMSDRCGAKQVLLVHVLCKVQADTDWLTQADTS